ncbi:hypothetical protein U9M48_025943 [Paspalum notatum var. saurae]|uniref:Bowman-Birk serine protease inhibitors family domain-containing protein n=1 Tax=Paspalum notatum var. saurae TaxID=547442 RepID=A0AAQ3WXP0_PASNO
MKNTTRNKQCGVLLMLLTVLFLIFALSAQCRPHNNKQQQLHVVVAAGTASSRRGQQQANTTVDDESKLVLKFCTLETCEGHVPCYCCQTLKPYPDCYEELKDCQAVCPPCNPKCPPKPPAGRHTTRG